MSKSLSLRIAGALLGMALCWGAAGCAGDPPQDRSAPEPAQEEVVEPLTDEERAGLDLELIATGIEVDLEAHLVSGKITVFDYYAEWCAPCHSLAQKLERRVLGRGDVAIRKIDVLAWSSPAAKQAAEEHGMGMLPYLRVYGPRGEFRGAVSGNDIEALEALLK